MQTVRNQDAGGILPYQRQERLLELLCSLAARDVFPRGQQQRIGHELCALDKQQRVEQHVTRLVLTVGEAVPGFLNQ